MGKRLAFVVLVALTGCTAAPKASVLPSGTYHYASHEGGVNLDSTVTVSRGGKGTLLHEEAQFGAGAQTVIETRLDPKTYSVVAYSTRGDPDEEASITISTAGATFDVKNKGIVAAKAPAAGAPSWIFESWASNFMPVPALLHATGAKRVNSYHSALFRGRVFVQELSVVAVTDARPDGVPSTDASVGLTFGHIRKSAIGLWYDPATFIVDGVTIGGGTAFVRQR